MLITIAPNSVVSNDPEAIRSATHLILTGVGAFGAAMTRIRANIPMEAVEPAVFKRHKPFLGICVGFQVLADRGSEFGDHAGLGWLGGTVEHLRPGTLPLAHVGWSSAAAVRGSSLMAGIRSGEDFYFVHSYAVRPTNPLDIVTTTDY